MKKRLLSLFALVSAVAFSQSLSINPDSYYYAQPGDQCVAHFDVTNTTDNNLSVIVTRSYDSSYDITSTFCWGLTCYPPTINVSGVPITIPAHESFDGFTGYLNDMPEETSYIINYCFSLENDPSDKVCIDVTFTSLSEYIGVDELDETYAVYPNPANNALNLDYNSETSASFVLYDMLGSKVYAEELSGASTIDLTSFESGIYFYSFNVEGREAEVQKLIIAH